MVVVCRGQRVRLHSLVGRPELNEREGMLRDFVESKGRWQVDLSGECVLLKAANLQPKGLSMEAAAKSMPDAHRRALQHLAACRMREAAAAAAASTSTETRQQLEAKLQRDVRVWQISQCFDATECDAILSAVDAAAERRGHWDRLRHGKHPTTDMPIGEVLEVEALVRAAVFRRVLCPLAPIYFPPGFLPEHLELRDAFYVKYSAAPGEQRELELHVCIYVCMHVERKGSGSCMYVHTCMHALGAALEASLQVHCLPLRVHLPHPAIASQPATRRCKSVALWS